MSQADIGAALTEMARCFPNANVTPETYRAYAKQLAHLDPRAVRAAIMHLTGTHRYPTFPTVGDIIAAVFDLVPPDDYPTPDEAWGLVRAKVHLDYEGADLMDRALKDTGGRHGLDNADAFGQRHMQTRFLERYRELLAEMRRPYASAPDVLALLDGVERPFLPAPATTKRIGGGA